MQFQNNANLYFTFQYNNVFEKNYFWNKFNGAGHEHYQINRSSIIKIVNYLKNLFIY